MVQKKAVFKFPADRDLSRKWIEFLNREDFEVTTYSVICIDHFEVRFVPQHPTSSILNYSMNTISIIHPNFIPLSLATVPSKPPNSPTIRIYQPDELDTFKSKFQLSLFIKLRYEGCSIALQSLFICTGGCMLTSLDMLTNLQVYCRNSELIYETSVIKELIQRQFYSPKGIPPYSSTVLRFVLLKRYASNSAYRYLKRFLPLPSYMYKTN